MAIQDLEELAISRHGHGDEGSLVDEAGLECPGECGRSLSDLGSPFQLLPHLPNFAMEVDGQFVEQLCFLDRPVGFAAPGRLSPRVWAAAAAQALAVMPENRRFRPTCFQLGLPAQPGACTRPYPQAEDWRTTLKAWSSVS